MPSPHSKARRTRDTTTIKRVGHRNDTRVLAAAKEVEVDQRRLDARMAYERAQERLSQAQDAAAPNQVQNLADALRQGRERELARAQEERDYQEAQEALRERYPYGEARDLVRAGYSVTHVARRTGWPADMLGDVQAGKW